MRALDEAAVVAWASACVHSLDVLRPAINGINVYPVADSDTGSNLLHTITGARDALADGELTGAGQALSLLARGAVRNARGNSGVILSQVLRGLAESAAGAPELGGDDLAQALVHADRVATEAVARPVAGTMLTVLHAAAKAAKGDSLDEVVVTAAKAASTALAQTPQQLPVLASAGVVDAGARGLVAVLDALAGVVTGTATELAHSCEAHTQATSAAPAPYAWEVMYLLEEVTEPDLHQFRHALSSLGDSVTVAGDGSGAFAVHVHCADIGAAIEAGLEVGRPRRIRVEPLVTPIPLVAPTGPDRTVVAVVRGDGLAELLREEGVAVLAVSQGARPSVEEMLGLVTERAVGHITILPGDAQLTTAADETAGHAMIGDREVVVIPCASPVQVLAALAVHDPARRVNDDVVAMAEAAAATRRGELVVAEEESITWVGLAHAGDLIGFVDGEVVLVEPLSEENLVTAAMTLLRRMLAVGGELVTVITGAAAPEGVAGELADQLCEERPEVEFVSYPGGQTEAVLLIGVE
ncbi:DAK2 domain-containing protein [Amycolatopsis acidiphila]|uniref:DAK2 domain-containing protein n=1 Tax=Amycolatopsis acidiphila TaxID=715473 RepID=A0A558AC76_9PSEU|nr:DAK2 domain-containing protein [Amycolatopsis acidiphila]TVT21803.1 DAK2 domain-containing protein [Amycolatopsis acidiphila]UIJ61523.1 DAK2 domain-containing protein [Amycolatopsis acidiphila]GHG59433.1 dihydroxyacetone kinase [Amycolatopsis acidiphila]